MPSRLLATGALLLERALDALQFGLQRGLGLAVVDLALAQLGELLLGLDLGRLGGFDLFARLAAQLAQGVAGLGLDLLAGFGGLAGGMGANRLDPLVDRLGGSGGLGRGLLGLLGLLDRFTGRREGLEFRVACGQFGLAGLGLAFVDFLGEGLDPGVHARRGFADLAQVRRQAVVPGRLLLGRSWSRIAHRQTKTYY